MPMSYLAYFRAGERPRRRQLRLPRIHCERTWEAELNSLIQKPVGFGQFRRWVKSLGMYRLTVNQPPVAGLTQTAKTSGATR